MDGVGKLNCIMIKPMKNNPDGLWKIYHKDGTSEWSKKDEDYCKAPEPLPEKKHETMGDGKIWDIWCEGFKTTGQEQGAKFMGVACGHTFKEACNRWYDINPLYAKYYDPDRNADWGCYLYPTEAEARESFG